MSKAPWSRRLAKVAATMPDRWEIEVPPSTIVGAKQRLPSHGDAAQKHYEEATEHFISAYQSYEKTRVFLKRAEETGDLEGIDIFTFSHLQSQYDLMNAIHAMDQAKSSIRMHVKNETLHRSHP